MTDHLHQLKEMMVSLTSQLMQQVIIQRFAFSLLQVHDSGAAVVSRATVPQLEM
ncbi:hypothetical protein LZ198_37395 [Myxococcus sp. K15C18031901]|uniref:hypothetical protein n=1 Tax=Myxococcus dinghuensis TaxID=2906761 RepID=UPI0020A7E87F|nr:hypothetical protein [Myxococcus dinghuensis]MCP3104553.1 hypothetical protein [Myxococcus dinghuensis]